MQGKEPRIIPKQRSVENAVLNKAIMNETMIYKKGKVADPA